MERTTRAFFQAILPQNSSTAPPPCQLDHSQAVGLTASHSRGNMPFGPSPSNVPGTELSTHPGLHEPKYARLSQCLERRRLPNDGGDYLSVASDSDWDSMELDRRRASTPKIDALKQQGQGPEPLSPAPSPTPVVRPYPGPSDGLAGPRLRQRVGPLEKPWSPAPQAHPTSPETSRCHGQFAANNSVYETAVGQSGSSTSGDPSGCREAILAGGAAACVDRVAGIAGTAATTLIANPSGFLANPSFTNSSSITQEYGCMTDEQKIDLLRRLLDQSSREVLLTAQNHVEPKLKHDPFCYLPGEISLRIISYLDTPGSLAAASQVSRSWYLLLSDDTIWKRLCNAYHYRKLSAVGQEFDSAQHISSKDSSVAYNLANLSEMQYDPTATEIVEPTSYRSLFRQQYLLRSAWETGGRSAAHYKFDFMPNVIATAFVMNQNYIVMSMDNSRILVFSSAGKLLCSLYGHVMGVWALALNGHTLVSGGCDRGVRVWDLRTGLCNQVLKGHASTIRCLEMASEDIAVSSSRDATIRVWNVRTGECLRVLEGHTSTVRRIWASAERNLIVSASYDCTARVWNMETGEQIHVLQGHLGQIYSLAVEGNVIATGSLDMSIRIWNIETGACCGVLQGHLALVGQLCIRGNTLVSGASDSAIRIWDLSTMQCRLRIAAHDNSVTCLQYDGERILSGGPDGQIHIWDAQTGRQLRTLGYRLSTVWGIAALDDRLAFVGVQGSSTVVGLLSFVPRGEIDYPVIRPQVAIQTDGGCVDSLAKEDDILDDIDGIEDSDRSSVYTSGSLQDDTSPSNSAPSSLSATFGPALIRPSSQWQDVAARSG